MPLYDYACGRCGPFRTWQAMSKSGDPTKCPECCGSAPRAVASPHIRGDAAAVRYKAEARNEKSAHEPTVARRLKNGQHAHDHAHGHTHAAGSSDRPWMLGH